MQYSLLPDYRPQPSDKFVNSAAGESRTVFHPTMPSQLHPRRLFTRQNNEGSIRPLNPHLFGSYQHQVYQSSPPFTNVPPHHQWEESSQGWVQNYHPIPPTLKQNEGQSPYPSFPSPSLFPPTHLSPRPLHHAPFHAKGSTQSHRITLSGNRLAFTESMDLNTGLLLRTPEHPRLRTAQACEKCRVRKAKVRDVVLSSGQFSILISFLVTQCSGEHPKCKRCCDRNLNCEYAKEGRVRGPNKSKAKISGSPGGSEPSPVANTAISGRSSCRARTSSATSSTGSSGHSEPPIAVRSGFNSTTSDLNTKSTGGRNTGRNSMSLDISAQARSPNPVLDPASDLFRRQNSARCNITLLTDSDYFFLQQEETQSEGSDPRATRGFMDSKRQTEQHYDLHGNSLIMQGDCRVIGHPPSPSSGFARGPGLGRQYQPENSLTYAIHQSELVPLGLNGHIVTQSDAVHTPDLVFPSSHGFENSIHIRHQQQEAGSMLNRYVLS